MNVRNLSSLLLLTLALPLWAKDYTVKSPDGRNVATVCIGSGLTFSIVRDGQVLLHPSSINMVPADGQPVFGSASGIRVKRSRADQHIPAPFYRQSDIRFAGNQLDLSGPRGFGLRVMATDEGVAYRFYTTRTSETTVHSEVARYVVDSSDTAWISTSTNDRKPMAMAFQNIYTTAPLAALPSTLSFLPVVVSHHGTRMTIAESDLTAYPGMFASIDNSDATQGRSVIAATFAPYPKRMDYYAWRHMTYVAETEPFIARSTGARSYPWRVFAIADRDTDMPTNNLVYALAEPTRLTDTSWIKPGKAAWDWWCDWNLKGVDFKAGINTDTYRYYIDFAAKNHLEYIILDEGWYDAKQGDIMHPVPQIDLPALVAYGRQKGVGIVLWAVFNVMDEQLETVCRHYADMGIKGFKVDFLDRNDQTAVEMVARLADCAARHRLILDLHGIYPPAGLNRTYPNVLNYESVFGMEEVKWGKISNDHPRYDVTFPFIRMMAGQVDFTQGAMRNGTRADWTASYSHPVSQGTRCHQAAAYIVYDSPFTMLADTPTSYEAEPLYTSFLASLPTVFRRTEVLQGRMGEYIVTLREKDGVYYIGALTNWTPRDLHVPLHFLPRGVAFQARILADGINADHNAEDYQLKRNYVGSSDSLHLHMAPGGGYVAVLAPATR